MPWISQSTWELFEQLRSDVARVEWKLDNLSRAEQRRFGMAQADIDALKQKVEQNGTVAQSAVTLINGLAQQIRDAQDDPQELQALASSLEAQSQALAAAVTANTPAQPQA